MDLSLLTKVADEIEKKEGKSGGKPPFMKGGEEKKETPPAKEGEGKEAPKKPEPEEAGMNPAQEKQHEAGETPKEEAAEEAAEGEGGEAPMSDPGMAPQAAAAPINIIAIVDFLQQNPNPDDATFHQFAEGNGWDVHQAEAMMYGLATKAVNLFRGGMMNETQLDIASVNPNELALGTKIEFKHTTDESIAKKLALDNLAVTPDYYTRLQKMESEAMAERDAAIVPMNNNSDIEDGENEPQGQTNMPAYNVSTRDPY